MSTLSSRARRLMGLAATSSLIAAVVLVPNIRGAKAAVGDITEYPISPTASDRPFNITAGPDGNLWFTESKNVVKVTPLGVFTGYHIPSVESGPGGITAGPDGNIWFTEQKSNKVAKVTPSGVVTEYPVPTAGALAGITAGPDGNVWFTEYSGNIVAKITPSGVVTEYTIPTTFSFPNGIAAGADGNLWFNESGGKLAKVTTAGVFTEYPASISYAGVTNGPDGNLWFTDLNYPGKLAKVTTAGVINEYSVPTSSPFLSNSFNNPQGVTSGPDGNVWFAENSANKVAKVTTSGVFTEYVVPSAGSTPSSIVTGPDGNLWFTENSLNIVARVTTSGVFTEFPVPTGGQGASAIASGPDGNLWVAESGPECRGFCGKGALGTLGEVAKVTTSGVITRYQLPSGAISPEGITAGPDGNLWITESSNADGSYGEKVAKVTTAGTFTEYTTPTAHSAPAGIAAGADGNLWFTESAAGKVARVTTAGAFTEYAIPTAGSFASAITAGPDGNLWFTEPSTNKVARATTAGAVTEFSVPTAGASPGAITTGPDGNLWFTENNTNKVARLTPSGVITEYTLPGANALPQGIATGPDGNLWVTERDSADKVARMTTSGVFTEYNTLTNPSNPSGIVAGPDGNMWFTEGLPNSAARVVVGTACTPTGALATAQTAVSTNQYTLQNSDGAAWQEIDAANLRVSCTPTANQAVLLTANADLFTANAGFNQDIGIFVSDNGGGDQLLAWKESGGFAGTFSPNAAYAQALFNETNGHAYIFKLKWKTNKNAPGSTIYSGAGPIGGHFSPTSLVAESFPTGVIPNAAVSTQQYTQSNSDGATWVPMDATNLKTTLSPGANSTAVLGANVDLFTANAGVNQDIAIFVSDNGGAFNLVAWKESGGFAGTFSPNAAFVRATYPMTGGHTYIFRLEWKSNTNAPGTTLYGGAGPISAQFSPTSIIAQTIASGANPYSAVSTSQYTLSNSNGVTWQPMDAALNVTVTPGADTNSIVGANADLFTNTAGYNQDIGIFVSDNGGADELLAWKESGGFAGTFSPNAAFAQYTYQMASGHTYVFKLKWKTNRDAPGTTIYAAAGGPAPFSPTRLTVELTN